MIKYFLCYIDGDYYTIPEFEFIFAESPKDALEKSIKKYGKGGDKEYLIFNSCCEYHRNKEPLIEMRWKRRYKIP